jgi:hypothetical protein
MRGRRLLSLITVLVTAATVLLTSSFVGPVDSTEASAGGFPWRSDLDAASTAIPTAAQPTVQAQARSLLHVWSNNAKATAVAAVSTTCDGCDGQATTLQVVYFDGRGPVAADNLSNAVSQCHLCPGPVASSAVSVQVVLVKQSNQLTVNNSAFALNLDCGTATVEGQPPACTTTSMALQFVLVGGSRRDLTAAAKDLVGQLQDILAGRLATAAQAPAGQAQARIAAETGSITDQLQAVLVQDTGSTSVQRNIDIKVG